jgi:hypothetical protein
VDHPSHRSTPFSRAPTTPSPSIASSTPPRAASMSRAWWISFRASGRGRFLWCCRRRCQCTPPGASSLAARTRTGEWVGLGRWAVGVGRGGIGSGRYASTRALVGAAAAIGGEPQATGRQGGTFVYASIPISICPLLAQEQAPFRGAIIFNGIKPDCAAPHPTGSYL